MWKSHFDAVKYVNNGSVDLLCLGAINDRVEHRRHEEVDVGQKDMDESWHIFPKVEHHGDPNHWYIKCKHSQDV